MDTNRYKRRETQTRRSTSNQSRVCDIALVGGIPQPVATAVVPPRPQPAPQPTRITVIDANQPVPAAPKRPAPAAPPMDMALPGGPSGLKLVQPVDTDSRFAKVRRWSLRSALVMTVLVLGVGGWLVSQGYFNAHKVFRGNAAPAAALTANVDPQLLKGEGDGRVNILLLGRGGGNHDGPDLTDTMMVASIDPVNHKTALISVPRDLWVDVPNQGAMKINAAWETGEFKYLGKISPGSTNPQAIQAGFEEADQVVESVTGVPIHYNMLVDFAAFQQAVNTVDGVTIDVPADLVDPTMAWENGNNPVLAKAGLQQFDGKHALIYARSRETTSDFARSQRQRALMVALKGKVETLGTLSNPIKIAGLMSAFGNNVQTDLSLNDASRLYSIIKAIPDGDVTSIGLADGSNHYIRTGAVGNQSVDLPTAGMFNYGDIQAYIRSQLPDGYLVKENARVLVLNGTATPGLATTVADQLKSYGYNVVDAANAPGKGWSQTTLIDLTRGKAKYTAHYLEQRFNLMATTSFSNPSIPTNGADFVIIIGSDEASTPKI